MSGSCVFCDIIAGTAPAVIVREWVDTIAILPREENGKRGCTEGHILVIPKVHVTDFTEDPVVSAVTALRLAELARNLGGQWNEITSAGPDATQTVGHLHRHLVPRRPGDGLALPWAAQTAIAAELERLVDETDWAWAVGDSLKARAEQLRGGVVRHG